MKRLLKHYLQIYCTSEHTHARTHMHNRLPVASNEAGVLMSSVVLVVHRHMVVVFYSPAFI